MDMVTLSDVLLWCTIINYGLLVLWFVMFTAAHDWMYGLHCKWFKLSVDHFDAAHYAGMAIFKIAVFVFNLVPYLALLIVG